MKLRQLEYVVAVAEGLHFTRAAASLGVSQSVLSKQIRALETELGASLFMRTSRKVTLTPFGESFLMDARLILDQVDAAKKKSHSTSGSALRVGAYTIGASAIGRRIIDSYKEAAPNTEVDIVMLDWGETAQALREGRIDIGFIRTPPKGPFADHAGLIITRLQLDPRVAAVRRDHALASRRQLSVQQLNPYPIVANRGVSVAARAWWIVNPRPDGSVPTQLRSASSVGELLEAVAMTGDIAITTKSSAEIHLRPDIKYIPLVDIDPAVISLAWDSASSNPSVRRFVEIARKMTEI